jgi:hypothetical protein
LNAIYQGDSRLRGFPCWDRLHLVEGKLYHLGFRGKVARSTLADANQSHDWRSFADFAQVLIRIARPLYATTKNWRRSRSKSVRSGFDDHRSVSTVIHRGGLARTDVTAHEGLPVTTVAKSVLHVVNETGRLGLARQAIKDARREDTSARRKRSGLRANSTSITVGWKDAGC